MASFKEILKGKTGSKHNFKIPDLTDFVKSFIDYLVESNADLLVMTEHSLKVNLKLKDYGNVEKKSCCAPGFLY